MTDDELMREEVRALGDYFAYRGGEDSDEPLNDLLAALMRHCAPGIENIR